MENKNSPSTPRGRATLYIKSENSSLNRKPLSQITNICNNSPILIKENPMKHNYETEEPKENLSPSVSSSSKFNLCSFENGSSSHSSKRNAVESSQNYHSTPSSVKTSISTPHSNSNMSRYSGTPRSVSGQCTPKTFIPYNPFEMKAELLQLPTVSPSLFKEVVSPSEKEDTNFAWAIDNLAILCPVPIESPGPEMEIPADPEYERKAQEAIDKFFSNAVVVPSPWTDSSKSINVMSAIFSSSKKSQELSSASPALLCSSREDKKENVFVAQTNLSSSRVSTSCQTELSLPPVLPKEVEVALAPYFTFTQDVKLQNNEDIEDSSALNNTTLRRKLLFSDEFSSVQQSTPLSRDSPNIMTERAEIEASSPASIGPLPLDDDDAVLPWSVSMIRPSLRASSHFPLSSPLQSSTEQRYSCSSGIINCSSGDKSCVIVTPMLSPHGVSPITYFSPNNLRSLPSPSECQQTPRRKLLESPKLSPILNCSGQTLQMKTPSPSSSVATKLSSGVSRSPLEYPRGKRGRNVASKPEASPLFENQTRVKINNENSVIIETGETNSAWRSEGEINSDSQGFAVRSASKSERKTTEHIKTPIYRGSHRLTFKTSPYFSSSPIKGSNAYDSSSSYQLEINKLDEKKDNCSSRFSDSPPFSPISWKSDNAVAFDFNLKEDDRRDGNITSDTMEDEAEIGLSSQAIKASPIRHDSKFEDEGNSTTVLDKCYGHSQEIIMSSVTYADAEFPNLFEESTLEEISCGQDTGYQTGSLSQINPSNQSSNLTTLRVTNLKETQGISSEKHFDSASKKLLEENVCKENDKVFCSSCSH